jgi:hypothetical protein
MAPGDWYLLGGMLVLLATFFLAGLAVGDHRATRSRDDWRGRAQKLAATNLELHAFIGGRDGTIERLREEIVDLTHQLRAAKGEGPAKAAGFWNRMNERKA